MGDSFALKGALRYLKDNYEGEELKEISKICGDLAQELSEKRGYLHPRALAAASAYVHKSRKGRPNTLEATSAQFKVSAATLREYLRAYPLETNVLEVAKNLVREKIFGADLPQVLQNCETLYEEISDKRGNINPVALAASAAYIFYYQDGRDISVSDVAGIFGISASTLREYVNLRGESISYVERAKTILERVMGENPEKLNDALMMVDKLGEGTEVSTARILAAMTYYLYKIKSQEYTTIEKVSRMFNVSSPALRSYLAPYLSSISDCYLIFSKGRAYNIEKTIKGLTQVEMDMLKQIYTNFQTSIFELGLLFKIPNVPKGRWQLFIRKLARLGLVDIYRKPLDPKQYCALVEGVKNYVAPAEKLDRWV